MPVLVVLKSQLALQFRGKGIWIRFKEGFLDELWSGELWQKYSTVCFIKINHFTGYEITRIDD